MDPETNEAEVLTHLLAELSALPQSKAIAEHLGGGHDRLDAMVDLTISDSRLTLLVEVKREAYPRDIKETLWNLRHYAPRMDSLGHQVIPFIAARSISQGARDLLRREEIGFYDLGGSLFIPAGSVYIFIDRPPPKRKRRSVSIFQGQKARTIMTLFAHGDADWVGVHELAELAEASPATVSATLSEMERHDWVESQGSGPSKLRRLRNRRGLVDEWASHVAGRKPPQFERFYVPGSDALDVCRKLDAACRPDGVLYAVTGEAAAQLYAPYLSAVSQVRCRIEPGPARARILERMDARLVTEGWNLALIETRSSKDIIVGDEIEGICLAPVLQVYLDLLQSSGRSREMAEHLRAAKLGI